MRTERALAEPHSKFTDLMTPNGWERIRFRNMVRKVNNALRPHMSRLATLTEEPTVVVKETKSRGWTPGHTHTKLTAWKEGEGESTTVLRLYRRSRDHWEYFDNVNRRRETVYSTFCEVTVVRVEVSTGRIAIEVGKTSGDDNPGLESVHGATEQADALRGFAMALKAA